MRASLKLAIPVYDFEIRLRATGRSTRGLLFPRGMIRMSGAKPHVARLEALAYFRRMLRPILFVTFFIGSCASATDWPRRGGPQFNNISTETGWQAEWSGNGPKELWSAEVGLGFSSFVVADGRVFTTGHAEGQDTVFCHDAVTGQEKWKHSYPP